MAYQMILYLDAVYLIAPSELWYPTEALSRGLNNSHDLMLTFPTKTIKYMKLIRCKYQKSRNYMFYVNDLTIKIWNDWILILFMWNPNVVNQNYWLIRGYKTNWSLRIYKNPYRFCKAILALHSKYIEL